MYFEALDDVISEHLRKSGKTQAALAGEMNMSPNTFAWKRKGENGKEFKMSELLRLCVIVGVDLDDVMVEQRDKYGWPDLDAAGDAV